MCGIIYYKDFTGKTVNHLALKHYLKQKNRGHEGFGFVGVSKRRILTCRAIKENGIRFHLKQYPMTEILFHHRMPTSTANTIQTTHPIAVSQPVYKNKYYLIHNGIIYNASELKAKHEEMGITYVTSQLRQYSGFYPRLKGPYEFNDSEALAHEVALFLDGRQENIEAQGDTAFICLETDRNNNALRLHFARNRGAPLEMRRDSSSLVIASENVSNVNIPPHRLHTYDYRTQNIVQHEVEFPEFMQYSHLTSYPPAAYWDEAEEMEMMIQEYEDRLLEIEQAQFRASGRGDFVLYQRLQREKDQIEEQMRALYDEWRCLQEGIC